MRMKSLSPLVYAAMFSPSSLTSSSLIESHCPHVNLGPVVLHARGPDREQDTKLKPGETLDPGCWNGCTSQVEHYTDKHFDVSLKA